MLGYTEKEVQKMIISINGVMNTYPLNQRVYDNLSMASDLLEGILAEGRI